MSSNKELNAFIANLSKEADQRRADKLSKHVDWIEANLANTRYNTEMHEMYYREYVQFARELIASGEIFNPDRETQTWDVIHNLRYPASIKGTANELYTIIRFNQRSNTTQCYISIAGKTAQVKGEDLLVFQAGWPREYTVQVKTGVKNEFGVIKVYTEWLKYENIDRLAVANYEQQFCWMVDYPKFKSWVENNHDLYGDVTERHYLIPAQTIKNCNEFRFMDLS